MDIFEAISTEVGDMDNCEILTVYNENGKEVTYEQFVQSISEYEGIQFVKSTAGGYFDLSGPELTVEDIIRQLRG